MPTMLISRTQHVGGCLVVFGHRGFLFIHAPFDQASFGMTTPYHHESLFHSPASTCADRPPRGSHSLFTFPPFRLICRFFFLTLNFTAYAAGFFWGVARTRSSLSRFVSESVASCLSVLLLHRRPILSFAALNFLFWLAPAQYQFSLKTLSFPSLIFGSFGFFLPFVVARLVLQG